MKKTLTILLAILLATPLIAQRDNDKKQKLWSHLETLLSEQRYATAYTVADSLRRAYMPKTVQSVTSMTSRHLLAATWFSARATYAYQEDAEDSAQARFRAIMPFLTPVDRSLCYIFLGKTDSALVDSLELRKTRVEDYELFLQKPADSTGINLTPTLYELAVNLAQRSSPQRECKTLLHQLISYYRTLPLTLENEAILIHNEIRYANYVDSDDELGYFMGLLNRHHGSQFEEMAWVYRSVAQKYIDESDYLTALTYLDSAIALYPQGAWTASCIGSRDAIFRVLIDLDVHDNSPAERNSLAVCTTRNIDTVFYRIVPMEKGDASMYYHKLSSKLHKRQPLHQWCQPLDNPADHRTYSHFVYLPQLPVGDYILMASPFADFPTEGFQFEQLHITPVAISGSCDGRTLNGYVLDYATGKPVGNQKVELLNEDTEKSVAKTTTDKDGFFSFKNDSVEDMIISIKYKGYEVRQEVHHYGDLSDTSFVQSKAIFDRPIYRPSDTLHFSYITGRFTYPRSGATSVGDSVKVWLMDVNYQKVDSLVLVTDSFGLISGSFVIPSDALPGNWRMRYQNSVDRNFNDYSYSPFEVEAYKQPTFAVSLHAVVPKDAHGHSVVPSLGDTLVVEGVAASFNQVSLSGATVRYKVTRSAYSPIWRRYSNILRSPAKVLLSDTISVNTDGRFRIAFVAEPDTNVKLSEKPNFQYDVEVDVSDLNGETQSQSQRFRVGCDLGGFTISNKLDTIRYNFLDLNDNPISATVQLTVEQLRVPDVPYIEPTSFSLGNRQYLSRDAFHKHYPMTAYDSADCIPSLWPVAKVAYSATVRSRDVRTNTIPLPKLPAGYYRVRLSSADITAEEIICHTPASATKVVNPELLWADLSNNHVGTPNYYARIGDTIFLRLGTRHPDVTAICQIVQNGRLLSHQILHPDNNITTLRIPVTEASQGGLHISLLAIKDGFESHKEWNVHVPITQKQLDVKFTSFRDKLSPGDKETWTISVSNKSGDAVHPAALVLSMFDASLLNIQNTSRPDFHWDPWPQGYVDFFYFDPQIYRFFYSCYFGNPNHKSSTQPSFHPNPLRSWNLRSWMMRYTNGFVGGTARGESGMVTMSNSVRKRAGVAAPKEAIDEVEEIESELAIIEIGVPESGMRMSSDDIARMPGTSVESILTEVGGVGYNDEAAPQAAVIPDNIRLRSNHSTLAFFEPSLRTAPDGTVSYSFTAPDLLTSWSINGLAWTPDLSIGTVQNSLITQKQLMIQPNMPRFLREGDKAQLLAKVTNLTDSTLNLTVAFEFAIQGHPTQSSSVSLSVPPHDVLPVSFPVEAPVGGIMATYKFVAFNDHFSDGEQGPLPLPTNRQAVTTSVSMYHNGTGTKDYSIQLPQSATAQPVSLTVEYTSNPIWLAIQSLPFMSDKANPSTIYLSNTLYVDILGEQIAQRLPQLKESLSNLSDTSSRLFENADIKQTLLSETPWLESGQNEVERLRRISNYYDLPTLEKTIKESQEKLYQAQRSDGGWPWMPDGKYSSTYVTQHILRNIAQINEIVNGEVVNSEGQQPSFVNSQKINFKFSFLNFHFSKALSYIDKEAYKAYLDYQKDLKRHPNLTFSPDRLDYLYTRSFYTNKRLSPDHKKAYDFFYDNTKKHIDRYTDLHSQALLALIFHRNGDTQLAQRILKRIKEKALYNDEMGMYWRDNRSGPFCHQRPIETQALLIETFREVLPSDTLSIAQMQQWLLKQKQTTSWNTDIATLRAIQALLPAKTDNNPASVPTIQLTIGNQQLQTPPTQSGYLHHTYPADSISYLVDENNAVNVLLKHSDCATSSTPKSTNRQIDKSTCTTWGALYYQYTEQMDKVPASETGIKMTQELFVVQSDGSLKPLGNNPLSVGDRLRVRLSLSCDRNLEYVELKNFRASCLEPISTASGWRWNTGLSYYIAVNNSHDALYINRLEKGKYIIESEYFVTNPGSFTLAPSVLQCLYAPEFRATTQGSRVEVK